MQKKKDAVVQRWLEDALATYPKDGSALFSREKDPFANPVGHSLRVGTRGIFDDLLDGTQSEKTRQHLHEIIKIRAVQQFSASQAVRFVFRLKEVIRAELGNAVRDPQLASELTEFEGRIDRMALAAFDIFVQCREQVCELRVNEAKRRVSWIVDKLNERGTNPELARTDLE